MIEKTNLRQTLDRLLAFYEGRLTAGILACISPAAAPVSTRGSAGEPPPARVRECLALAHPGFCVEAMRRAAPQTRELRCDVLPVAYPTAPFGESVWAAFFGGEIAFSGTDTHTWSYCAAPPIQDLRRFAFPAIADQDPWLGRMLAVTEYVVSHLPPLCDVTPFIFMDCLNLLVELRGAVPALMDLYDCPEVVHEFMDWSVTVNQHVFDAQARRLREFTDAALAKSMPAVV